MTGMVAAVWMACSPRVSEPLPAAEHATTPASAAAPSSPAGAASATAPASPAASSSATPSATAAASVSGGRRASPKPGTWHRVATHEVSTDICGTPPVASSTIEEAWHHSAFFTAVSLLRLGSSDAGVGADLTPTEAAEMVERWRRQIPVVPWPTGGTWKGWRRESVRDGNVRTRIELHHSSGQRFLYCEHNG